MPKNEMHVICGDCDHEFDAIPKMSLLGFRRFVCPRCGVRILYPLSTGALILSWALVVVSLVATISSGRVILLGFLGIGALIAVVKDLVLRAQGRKPELPEATLSAMQAAELQRTYSTMPTSELEALLRAPSELRTGAADLIHVELASRND